MELTLGPIAYHWPTERKHDFYARIADEAPIGTVYLGEVVCSKRAPFFDSELPKVMERLERGGKCVVFSTLAEVVLERERQATRDLVQAESLDVEINNACGLWFGKGKRHRIGPFLNAYNEETLKWFASRGASHVCLPSELPGASVAVAAATAQALGVGVEIQVFGRVSLATSARCYHARAHGRTKDTCRFICEEDPDGMPLETRDKVEFLRVNGIQTQSHNYLSLLEDLPLVQAMGVTHVRLMPQDVDMVAVAEIHHKAMNGLLSASEAMHFLAEACKGESFSNGFFHGAAGRKNIVHRVGTV